MHKFRYFAQIQPFAIYNGICYNIIKERERKQKPINGYKFSSTYIITKGGDKVKQKYLQSDLL